MEKIHSFAKPLLYASFRASRINIPAITNRHYLPRAVWYKYIFFISFFAIFFSEYSNKKTRVYVFFPQEVRALRNFALDDKFLFHFLGLGKYILWRLSRARAHFPLFFPRERRHFISDIYWSQIQIERLPMAVTANALDLIDLTPYGRPS